MVHSLLAPAVDYPENEALLPVDEGEEASLYEIPLHGKMYTVALGRVDLSRSPKYSICSFPIYLILNDEVFRQIGVYEIMSNKQADVVATGGEIDIEQLGQPLLYKSIVET